MKNKLVILLWLISMSAVAQNISPQGSWHDYFSYYSGGMCVEANTRIYCVCKNALLYFDRQDSAIHRLSKVNGLHDVGIKYAAYNEIDDALVVVYENANVDIVYQSKDKIVNIPAIAQKQIYGNKSALGLACDGNLAYVLLSFGIVTINTTKQEISEVFYKNYSNVNQFLLTSNHFYLATTTGVMRCPRTKNSLLDSANWQRISSLPTLNYRSIYYQNNSLFAEAFDSNKGYDTLYRVQNGQSEVFMAFGSLMSQICPKKDGFALVEKDEIRVYDNSKTQRQTINWTKLPYYDFQSWLSFRLIFFDSEDTFWTITTDGSWSHEGMNSFLTPQSPAHDHSSHIVYKNNSLYLAHGTPAWAEGGATIIRNDSCYRFYFGSGALSIAPDNSNANRFFTGSYHGPMHEQKSLKQDDAVDYTVQNSPLEEPSWGGIWMSGLTIDNKSNIYLYNNYASKPIKAYTKDGKWYSWAYSDVTAIMGSLYIDRKNTKWLASGNYTYQIFVFNENNTLDKQSDDKTRTLSLVDASGESLAGSATCFAQDLDGVMWVGTNAGLVSFTNADQVLTTKSVAFNRIKVETNGYIEYLLASEYITCVYVDPGNRKWVGTKSGVYLISANGEEQLLHFTAENSPLPDDYVTSINMMEDKGEVFFATPKGVVSYSADVKKASEAMDNIIVSPNPVRPSFQGLISIDGLAANTEVKISDMAGNLVFQTVSNGGRAVWDGTNMRGNKVSTGVYMVFCTSEDASVSGTAKIYFVQ